MNNLTGRDVHTDYLREKLTLATKRIERLEANSSFPEEELRDIAYFASLVVAEAEKLERYVRNNA